MAFCGGCELARRGATCQLELDLSTLSAMERQRCLGERATALAEAMAESGHYNIDSTTVRAHVSAAGGKGIHQRAFGRSRGGFTSKFHRLGDARGRPIAFDLTPGETADCKTYDC